MTIFNINRVYKPIKIKSNRLKTQKSIYMDFKELPNDVKILETTRNIVLEETTTTRKLLSAKITLNSTDKESMVEIAIMHQRKSIKDDWENIEFVKLSTLKAGEEVGLKVNRKVTRELHLTLSRLYRISRVNLKKYPSNFGKYEFQFIESADKIDFVLRSLKILNKNGKIDNFVSNFSKDPQILNKISDLYFLSKIEKSLLKFESMLSDNSLLEQDWQEFFEENDWIFGYGLSYKFLTTLNTRAEVGQRSAIRNTGQQVDFLNITQAEIKFTVLVEIKKATTALVTNTPYRNGVAQLDSELVGGVAQIQSYCNIFQVTSASSINTQDMQSQNIYTVNPKGILVIGKISMLSDPIKLKTFELFRRGINNPEIICFDELYERAKFIVENFKKSKGKERPNG